MRKLLIMVACCLALSFPGHAQTATVSAIGSSTLGGQGATNNFGWFQQLMGYYTNLGFHLTVHNLSVSAASTFNGMPSSYLKPVTTLPPPNKDTPVLGANITAAMSFHPDVVLIAYPSNDFVYNFTLTQYLSNLRTIYDSVLVQGKVAYVTSPQPRNDIGTNTRLLLKQAFDSVMVEFGTHAVDFWDPLVDLSPTNLNGIIPTLTGDGIHPNDAGHQLLFQVIKTKNIFSGIILPLKLTSFTAEQDEKGVLVRWTAVNEGPPGNGGYFEVQRSADGSNFENIQQQNEQISAIPVDYSWTDTHPLEGKSFYRLKMTEEGTETYSKVVSLTNLTNEFSIARLYGSDGGPMLVAEINIRKDQTVYVTITNTAGVIVSAQSYPVIHPSAKIQVRMSYLASGQYILRITAANGAVETRAFSKF